jgi:hypothetical protein
MRLGGQRRLGGEETETVRWQVKGREIRGQSGKVRQVIVTSQRCWHVKRGAESLEERDRRCETQEIIRNRQVTRYITALHSANPNPNPNPICEMLCEKKKSGYLVCRVFFNTVLPKLHISASPSMQRCAVPPYHAI